MGTLRKGHCYNKITRPYTRKSKFKKKGFIKTIPPIKLARFTMGDRTKTFTSKVVLVTKNDVQIRHNALESARQIVNRNLNKHIGPTNYFFQVNAYPHHILRENKMLSGAHADRLQTGMAHSFGRPVGAAAQVKKNHTIFTVSVNKENINKAIEALKKAASRVPCKCGTKTY